MAAQRWLGHGFFSIGSIGAALLRFCSHFQQQGGKQMKTIRIPGLAVAVAAVLRLVSVLHAPAQTVAGATYTGEITGCGEQPCGTVHFTVSGDGSQVEGFTASDVPGDVCEFTGPSPFPIPLDIVDGSFGPGITGMYEVSGSFPREGSAQGTLRLVLDEPPCDSGVLHWKATTATTPT
jgi:hypothetical protein